MHNLKAYAPKLEASLDLMGVGRFHDIDAKQLENCQI